jgi:MFS family permease
LSAVTPDAGVLLFARTLIGLAIGADSAIATAYIAEYAPKSRRGSLTMLQQWMITVGILVSYVIALIIFAAFPASAQRRDRRLAAGPRPGRGARAGRDGAADPDAGVAPVAAAARPVRGRAQGHGRARHRGQHG